MMPLIRIIVIHRAYRLKDELGGMPFEFEFNRITKIKTLSRVKHE